MPNVRFLSLRMLLFALLLAGSQPTPAQPAASPGDPNMANPHRVVTVARDRYTIAGLVTHLEGAKAFKYAVALFPGYPSIMKLREEGGQIKFDLRGNFLVRSRRNWLDEETLVAVIDAPSDQWLWFLHDFRASPRYGADVAALLGEISRLYGVADWTLVGTSEGSVSAYHAARLNPGIARRTILTASLFRPVRSGPALSEVKWDGFPGKLLWVHHADDPCQYTSYGDAQKFAQRSGAPLVTVRGGAPGRGEACEAFTAHGFVGVELQTVRAMREWVKTGTVPGEVR
jgi:hypothetical protein